MKGLRVLDLSRIIAGPYAAMLLGDLGAEVIKVERPGRGDDMRWLRGGKGMSPIFAACNRNKRGVAIDLQHPDGQQVAFELARRADVIIENFVPGVAAKLGLGYQAVREANPTVVYASVSGFGQTGPYARRPGYNTIAMGMSGVMALTGWPDDPPTRPGGSLADLAASFLTFGGINAALVHRFRFGEGQYLDVDLLSAMMGMLPDPVADYFYSGRRPPRVGNRNAFLTPAESFRTKDGYLNVVLTGPDQYGRFCEGLADPDLFTHPKFAANDDRLAHHAEFKARVEERLATATTAEWVQRFEKAQVAASRSTSRGTAACRCSAFPFGPRGCRRASGGPLRCSASTRRKSSPSWGFPRRDRAPRCGENHRAAVARPASRRAGSVTPRLARALAGRSIR